MQAEINNITKYACSHHNKRIQYFCTVSQWHFIPLCSECLPDHTQKHAKNTKVIIESVQKVHEKYQQQRYKAIKAYTNKHQQIIQLIQNPKQDHQLAVIQQSRVNMLRIINKYYDKLTDELNTRKIQTVKYQNQLLNRLSTNISLDIQDLKNIVEIKTIEEWAQQAKRIYFKDGAQIYIEEIQQILEDHHKRHSEKYMLYDGNKMKKIQEELVALMKSVINIVPPEFQNDGKKIKIETKNEIKNEIKKKIPAPKPKICKNCGSEMQYLTEWKKHLICPNCGGKQRNYAPKK